MWLRVLTWASGSAGNTKATVEECAEACRNHKSGPHVGGAIPSLHILILYSLHTSVLSNLLFSPLLVRGEVLPRQPLGAAVSEENFGVVTLATAGALEVAP